MAKFHGPSAGGDPPGAPASEIKTLKYIFLHNYTQYLFIIFLFNVNLYFVIHSSNR
jgi:hypothetical protein